MAGAAAQPAPPPFDQTHAAWNALLGDAVVVAADGNASRVRYALLARRRAALKAYLDSISRVGADDFAHWPKPERMAFLINAYNALVVDKVLTRYPDIDSIRDFGRIFGNPFQDRFFVLLGKRASLDDIENQMLRKPGQYDDVRVHFALNCASIGCPMLRPEAYVGARLDSQLEDQVRRFLSDRSRNRFDARRDRLEVSKLFDWFARDWQRGTRNFDGRALPIRSRRAWLALHADALQLDAAARARVAAREAGLEFLDYDWSLNDTARRD
jgi:hypothetical protein